MVRFNLQLFAKKSVNAIAQEVIQGKWGNGATRQQKLTSAGYDYNTVQSKVNSLLGNNSSNKSTKSTKSTKTTTNKTTSNKSTKTTNIPTVEGVDSSWVGKAMSGPVLSEKTQTYGKNVEDIATKAQEHYDKGFIPPQESVDIFNTPYQDSERTTQAWDYLMEQSEVVKGGKTEFSDWYKDSLFEYANRDPFEYDVDNDQLFQQALASAMNSGKTAMQDTIGQASALTGGYGSTYATSAGNQAYNAFIEDAYNNLPQYYKMALEAYQAEGQEMAQLVNMLGQADSNAWGKIMDNYNAAFDIYGASVEKDRFAYTSEQTRARNLFDLAVDTHKIQSEDLMNSFNITNGLYETSLGLDLDLYKIENDNTWRGIELVNKDAWNQKTYDQTESHFNKNFGLQTDQFEWNKYVDQQTINNNNASQGLRANEYKLTTGDTNMDGVLSDDEKIAMGTHRKDESGKLVPVGNTSGENWSDTEYKNAETKYKNGGEQALTTYVETIGKQQGWSDTTIDNFIDSVLAGGDASSPTTIKAGTVSMGGGYTSFRSEEGDNFDITYEGETYRVENKGKVTDENQIAELDKASAGLSNKSVFMYNGDAYVKGEKYYYKVGATNGIFQWGETKGYSNFKKAMSKTEKKG